MENKEKESSWNWKMIVPWVLVVVLLTTTIVFGVKSGKTITEQDVLSCWIANRQDQPVRDSIGRPVNDRWGRPIKLSRRQSGRFYQVYKWH